MSIFEFSVKLLNASAFVYLAAIIFFIVGIAASAAKNQSRWLQGGKFFAYVAFVLHTAGILIRWYLGGVGRPPWTNLYESLVFFSWGVSLLQVIGLWRLRMPLLGLIASPVVFILMGMSVMTPNKLVEPLLPSLQSNWLKIHVVFGMLSYAGFTIAACFAFLHLLKNRVSLSKIQSGLAVMAILNLFIAGGADLVKRGELTMAKTVTRELPDGTRVQVKDTSREYEGGPMVTAVAPVPAGSAFMILSILSFVGAVFWLRRQKLARNLFRAALFGMLGLFTAIGVAIAKNPSLTLYSNSYLLFLLLMTFLFCLLLVLIELRYEKFLAMLPEASRLDELSYKNILFAFPFQTLLLVTGAIWAYYAWGRSWGWDPKETWAFITWVAYLIYLHGKLLLRWKPNFLSFVALCGFFILVFAFLGVNLVLSGLHSYGSV